MNIFKRRISLILSVVMLVTAILPIMVVNAASATVNYKATLDGKAVSLGQTYEVEGGEKVVLEASIPNGTVEGMGYRIGNGNTLQFDGNRVVMYIPESDEVNKTEVFYIIAHGKDENGNNVMGEWKWFFIKYVEPKEESTSKDAQVDMTITLGTKVLKHMSVLKVNGGETIKVKAKSSEADIYMIGYYYHKTSDGDTIDIHDDEIEIVLPKWSLQVTRGE